MGLAPEDTKWLFEDDDEWEDEESGSKPPLSSGNKPLSYEDEERIAIQQEGCNKRIDIVLRYPIED